MTLTRYTAKRADDGLYDLIKTSIKARPDTYTICRDHFSISWSAVIQAVCWALEYGDCVLITYKGPSWAVYRKEELS